MFTYITLRNNYKHVLTYTCMIKSKKLKIELPVTNITRKTIKPIKRQNYCQQNINRLT